MDTGKFNRIKLKNSSYSKWTHAAQLSFFIYSAFSKSMNIIRKPISNSIPQTNIALSENRLMQKFPSMAPTMKKKMAELYIKNVFLTDGSLW